MKKGIRKIVVSMLVFTALSTTTVFADNSPNISVNGEKVAFTDAKPYVDNNGRTMVPIAKIAEIFNAETKWDGNTQKITIKNDYNTIELQIGESEMLVDGKPVQLDTQPVMKNGRTYVPVKAISQGFGAKLGWNDDTQTVTITDTSLIKSDLDLSNLKYTSEEYSLINNNSANSIAIDGEYLYYTRRSDSSKLYRMNIKTGKKEKFLDYRNVKNIYFTDDKMIFTHSNEQSIVAVNKDGETIGEKKIDNLRSIQVVDDKIYCLTVDSTATRQSSNSANWDTCLYVMDLDFNNIKLLFDDCITFVINKDKELIYTSTKSRMMFKTDINGENKEVIVDKSVTDGLYGSYGGRLSYDFVTNKIYPDISQKYNQINVLNEDGAFTIYPLKNGTWYGSINVLDDVAYYYTKGVGVSSYNVKNGKETLLIEGDWGGYAMPHIIGNYLIIPTNAETLTYNLTTGEQGVLS